MEKYVTDNYIKKSDKGVAIGRTHRLHTSSIRAGEETENKISEVENFCRLGGIGCKRDNKRAGGRAHNELLERFPAIPRPQKRYHRSSRKPDVIDELIRVRQAAFDIDENLEDELRREAGNCVEIATSSRDREDELRNHSFYMFTDETKTKKSFVKKHLLNRN